MRPGSEVGTAIDGNQCVAGGMKFSESAKQVVLTDGFGGCIQVRFITQSFATCSGELLYNKPDGRIRAANGNQLFSPIITAK